MGYFSILLCSSYPHRFFITLSSLYLLVFKSEVIVCFRFFVCLMLLLLGFEIYIFSSLFYLLLLTNLEPKRQLSSPPKSSNNQNVYIYMNLCIYILISKGHHLLMCYPCIYDIIVSILVLKKVKSLKFYCFSMGCVMISSIL